MTPPSPADIEAAYLHGRWLRSHHTNPSERMLSDLSYEVERLRAEKTTAPAKFTDRYGNTEADPFAFCTFPDCGCDGARLCQARSGPNMGASVLNLEHRNPANSK